MPALEALLARFLAANTQPLGVSVDSVYSHANWAASMGGVSFPLLADFHPKGEVAKSLGMYIDAAGITARATVLIDAGGVVRFAEQVQSGRDMAALAKRCEDMNAAYEGSLSATPVAAGVPDGARLFIKSNCGFSRAVLLARDNLHLGDAVPIVNVSENPSGLSELEAATGKQQAPCLVSDGNAMLESKDIIAYLRTQAVGW